MAINVFGWEKDQVIHRLNEKDSNIPTINLILIQQHYVKSFSALLYDQSRNNGMKHFCERCFHGYTTEALLERHKPECIGQLKRPTRAKLPKEGENKSNLRTTTSR